jgi:serine/threonine protein kinase
MNSIFLITLSDLWVNIEDYDLGPREEVIGSGTNSRVVRATDKRTGLPVAIKFLKMLTNFEDSKDFVRELEILASNTHPATLRLLGVGFHDQSSVMIVTNFFANGSLDKILQKQLAGYPVPGWNSTKASICVFGTCAVMSHLHSKGILHRDLKPANVLLNDQFEPILADFGISRQSQSGFHTMEIGTPVFMAPELFDDEEKYDQPVDVYAFSVFLYSFFAEPTILDDRPARFRTAKALLSRIGKGARYVRPSNMTDMYWKLIQSAWVTDPNSRPRFHEILNDFHKHHNYVFPEADLKQVIEYENRILSEAPIESGENDEIKAMLQHERDNAANDPLLINGGIIRMGISPLAQIGRRILGGTRRPKAQFQW